MNGRREEIRGNINRYSFAESNRAIRTRPTIILSLMAYSTANCLGQAGDAIRLNAPYRIISLFKTS